MLPGWCCIANRYIGARERRQLIPHVSRPMPWTKLHRSEWYWRCPGPLSAIQTGAPVCSKVCPYDSFRWWDDRTIAPLYGWVDIYCCVFCSWWAYFTNIALYCKHWMMTMILWKCLNSESYVAIALAPSAQIWVTFFSLKWHFSHAAQFSFTGTEPQSDIGRNRKKIRQEEMFVSLWHKKCLKQMFKMDCRKSWSLWQKTRLKGDQIFESSATGGYISFGRNFFFDWQFIDCLNWWWHTWIDRLTTRTCTARCHWCQKDLSASELQRPPFQFSCQCVCSDVFWFFSTRAFCVIVCGHLQMVS